jgi:putative addiction module antidote
MHQTKLCSIGNSYGVILPKEIIAHLKINPDNKLFIIQTPNGVEITAYDPNFSKAIMLAEEIMQKNKNVLKKLAE